MTLLSYLSQEFFKEFCFHDGIEPPSASSVHVINKSMNHITPDIHVFTI